jgi:tetratricopeptide (TPR) repeat protein
VSYPFDLGRFGRPTSTSSPEAQAWFDRGLLWSYAFNHEEAVRCFEQAAAADETFALAHWGVAYAAGPTTQPSARACWPTERLRSNAQ